MASVDGAAIVAAALIGGAAAATVIGSTESGTPDLRSTDVADYLHRMASDTESQAAPRRVTLHVGPGRVASQEGPDPSANEPVEAVGVVAKFQPLAEDEGITCDDSSSAGEFSELASGFGVADPLIDLSPMLDLSSEDAISTILDAGLESAEQYLQRQPGESAVTTPVDLKLSAGDDTCVLPEPGIFLRSGGIFCATTDCQAVTSLEDRCDQEHQNISTINALASSEFSTPVLRIEGDDAAAPTSTASQAVLSYTSSTKVASSWFSAASDWASAADAVPGTSSSSTCQLKNNRRLQRSRLRAEKWRARRTMNKQVMD